MCSATPQVVLKVYSEFVDAEMTPKFSDVQRGMQKNGDTSIEKKNVLFGTSLWETC